MEINSKNVGRIAERIVMNELDARGYRATDLNKDGVSTNVDLIAVKDGNVFQVQVKGSSVKPDERWWIGFGSATQDAIDKKTTFFNSKKGHFFADIVVLVAVRKVTDYLCIVLPTAIAEAAAQLNLENYYRIPKDNGEAKKPHKVWAHFDYRPTRSRGTPEAIAQRMDLLAQQQAIFAKYKDAWERVFVPLRQTTALSGVENPSAPLIPHDL